MTGAELCREILKASKANNAERLSLLRRISAGYRYLREHKEEPLLLEAAKRKLADLEAQLGGT